MFQREPETVFGFRHGGVRFRRARGVRVRGQGLVFRGLYDRRPAGQQGDPNNGGRTNLRFGRVSRNTKNPRTTTQHVHLQRQEESITRQRRFIFSNDREFTTLIRTCTLEIQ